MKIINYNINGLRSAIKKGLIEWIQTTEPDIICLQETKIQKEQIPLIEIESLGYYHYWFHAQKKGYSGVGILSKKKPSKITYGTGIDFIDNEGRVLQIDLEACAIISLYLPSGSNMEKRLDFKLKFMEEFYQYIKMLKKQYPKLIICGDYNICHQAIDIHDPIRNARISGFLPAERKWMSQFIDLGFIDSFRRLNKEPHQYSWWSYRANSRENNKGWRIDYNMVSKELENNIKNALLLPDVKLSDHCPVFLEMNF